MRDQAEKKLKKEQEKYKCYKWIGFIAICINGIADGIFKMMNKKNVEDVLNGKDDKIELVYGIGALVTNFIWICTYVLLFVLLWG